MQASISAMRRLRRCVISSAHWHGGSRFGQETFREGFVFTGDEGYFDEQGMLYITDRIKELIKVRPRYFVLICADFGKRSRVSRSRLPNSRIASSVIKT